MDYSRLTDQEMVILSKPELITKELHKSLIQGLLIIDRSGILLLVRDFNPNYFFHGQNIDLLPGFISAINSFANGIDGFLTDIGIGRSRLIIKKRQDIFFCLFVDEILHQRNAGKDLLMLSELMLKDLIKTFESFFSLSMLENKALINREVMNQFQYQADLILLQSYFEAKRIMEWSKKSEIKLCDNCQTQIKS